MDTLNNDILGVLQELKELNNAFEEGKKAQTELSGFVAVLQEELKLARDAEKSAEFKKSRAQAFVSQQQDVILKLLHVKEENENLKGTISQLENTINDLQNSSMSDHVKKEAEIQQIKQDYFTELIKIQKAGEAEGMKIKAEMTSTIQELRESVSKKDQTIFSLEAEIKDLKERAAVNVDIFQKKMADLEREYQAELETWKVAELSRSTYQEVQNSVQSQNRVHNLYQPSRPSSRLQHQDPTPPTQPLVSRVRNSMQRLPPPNIVRPFTTYQNSRSTEFISASDFHEQNLNANYNVEGGEENTDRSNNENHPMPRQNPKIPVPSKRRKLFTSSINLLN